MLHLFKGRGDFFRQLITHYITHNELPEKSYKNVSYPFHNSICRYRIPYANVKPLKLVLTTHWALPSWPHLWSAGLCALAPGVSHLWCIHHLQLWLQKCHETMFPMGNFYFVALVLPAPFTTSAVKVEWGYGSFGLNQFIFTNWLTWGLDKGWANGTYFDS